MSPVLWSSGLGAAFYGLKLIDWRRERREVFNYREMKTRNGTQRSTSLGSPRVSTSHLSGEEKNISISENISETLFGASAKGESLTS